MTNDPHTDPAAGDAAAGEPETAAAGPAGAVAPEPGPAPDPIAVLEKEKVDLRERMLRVAAEFENWKKRSRKDLVDAQTKGKEVVLRDLLEVIDNLERAMASVGDSTDPKAIRDGVNLVVRLFHAKLERHDVHPVESKGKPFDPRMHEAVSRRVTADAPAGQVVEELTRGYLIGDRLLRPANVVVAAAPAEAPPSGSDASGKPESPAEAGGTAEASSDAAAPPAGSPDSGN